MMDILIEKHDDIYDLTISGINCDDKDLARGVVECVDSFIRNKSCTVTYEITFIKDGIVQYCTRRSIYPISVT